MQRITKDKGCRKICTYIYANTVCAYNICIYMTNQYFFIKAYWCLLIINTCSALKENSYPATQPSSRLHVLRTRIAPIASDSSKVAPDTRPYRCAKLPKPLDLLDNSPRIASLPFTPPNELGQLYNFPWVKIWPSPPFRGLTMLRASPKSKPHKTTRPKRQWDQTTKKTILIMYVFSSWVIFNK